jgi:hypothetical protein
MTPRTDIGFILHFPLNAAIKGEDVDWQLIPVDLAVGRDLADRLTHLRNATGTDAFGAPIVAAPTPSLVVEHSDTEGDGGAHTAAPSEALTLEERQRALHEIVGDAVATVEAFTPAQRRSAINSRLLDRSFDREEPPPAPDRRAALLERYANLTPADLAVFVMPADRSDLDAIEAELVRVESFADVDVAPVARTAPEPPVPPSPIDEGPDCTVDEVEAAGARFTKLDAAAKSWVSVAGGRVRLNPSVGGVASGRRRDVVSGLLTLAEGRFDSDDAVRAVTAHILGDIVWQGATVAETLGALTCDEARQFAALAALVAMTHDPFEFPDDGRTVLTAALKDAA